MTNEQMAETHAKLAEIAALTLSLEHLDAYIERVRGAAPALESNEHVDLATAVAGVQQVAHRLFDVDASAA